jgi:hypothetical protein
MTEKCTCFQIDWMRGDKSVTITLFCPIHQEVKKVGIIPAEIAALKEKEGEK